MTEGTRWGKCLYNLYLVNNPLSELLHFLNSASGMPFHHSRFYSEHLFEWEDVKLDFDVGRHRKSWGGGNPLTKYFKGFISLPA